MQEICGSERADMSDTLNHCNPFSLDPHRPERSGALKPLYREQSFYLRCHVSLGLHYLGMVDRMVY
jgi:hypothetical protein